jgi:N-methylhydantoinase A
MSAAEAILRVANAKMAGAIRLVSIERGLDPARFVALPFGGGGALHVGALLAEVGLKAALVPRFPGVTSALGCIIADVRHDQVRTLNLDLDSLDATALDAHLVREASAAIAVVRDAGLPVERIETLFTLDMHYAGQTHTVAVPLPVTVRLVVIRAEPLTWRRSVGVIPRPTLLSNTVCVLTFTRPPTRANTIEDTSSAVLNPAVL